VADQYFSRVNDQREGATVTDPPVSLEFGSRALERALSSCALNQHSAEAVLEQRVQPIQCRDLPLAHLFRFRQLQRYTRGGWRHASLGEKLPGAGAVTQSA
jgi:hypothetical protein